MHLCSLLVSACQYRPLMTIHYIYKALLLLLDVSESALSGLVYLSI
jgi:hypothetical protein